MSECNAHFIASERYPLITRTLSTLRDEPPSFGLTMSLGDTSMERVSLIKWNQEIHIHISFRIAIQLHLLATPEWARFLPGLIILLAISHDINSKVKYPQCLTKLRARLGSPFRNFLTIDDLDASSVFRLKIVPAWQTRSLAYVQLIGAILTISSIVPEILKSQLSVHRLAICLGLVKAHHRWSPYLLTHIAIVLCLYPILDETIYHATILGSIVLHCKPDRVVLRFTRCCYKLGRTIGFVGSTSLYQCNMVNLYLGYASNKRCYS